MNSPNTDPETPEIPTESTTSGNSPLAATHNTDSWLDSKLTLRSELKFDSRWEGENPVVVIEDPVRSKYFQIGEREYRFIALIDGQRTAREIIDLLNTSEESQNPTLTAQLAIEVSQWLVQTNLTFGKEFDNSQRLNLQAGKIKRQKIMAWINPISCKFRIFNPNQLLSKVQPYFQWVFSVWFFLIWCGLGTYASVQLYQHWDQLSVASTGILSGFSWIWLLVIWVALKLVHETAHGIACRKYGGEVPEAGVLLILFTPMAYVNVTSMWRFTNRWHRMAVSSAGMYVELFISFVAVITWTKTDGVTGDIAFNIFIMSSLTTILFNANPLMRFDGYFLLSDLLNIPNLYSKGAKWFGDRTLSLLFGLPKTENLCKPSERKSVAIYGCLAFFWKISISLSLIIGAGVLLDGVGLFLSILGVALWFGLPIYRTLKPLVSLNSQRPINLLRTALSLCILVGLGTLLFTTLKAPAIKSAPAIIQFSKETLVRSDADGFIQAILVNDGDQVRQGQELLSLKNPQITNEANELTRLIEESEVQYRIYRKQDQRSLALAEQTKQKELKAQLKEKKTAANGLKIRAPFDGFVFQRDLASQIGSFVNRGDEILTIAPFNTKEVVVSIDQRDLDSIHNNIGNPIKIIMPGLPLFQSPLSRVNPRASTISTHPSLCAHANGPLPVKPIASGNNDVGDQEFELLTPRFNAFIELGADQSCQLHSGQRGRAIFPTGEQSLGSYFYIAASEWLECKIKFATQNAAF
jgi:putative peptide zinc metalloprotease protein